MYAIVQKKEIKGSITRSNSDIQGKKLKLNEHGSNALNITALTNLYCGSGGHRKSLLDPNYGLLNFPSLIKAHLIKAKWDGGNNENRITQWDRDTHEAPWSANVESDVENFIATQPVSESEFGDRYGITVTTTDSNLGVSLMGTIEEFNETYANRISQHQYDTAKQMLDNQTNSVRMRVDGTDFERVFGCNACINLHLNPDLEHK